MKTAFALLVLSIFVVSCGKSSDSDKNKKDTAASKSKSTQLISEMAIYQEEEKGVEKPYTTRFIANSQYLRIDEGTNKSSYVLFDRADKIVYSVVHDQGTIMMITSKPVIGKLPKEIKIDIQKVIDVKTPKIAGRQTMQFKHLANSKECVTYIVVPNTLGQVVSAIREYRSVLAGQHALNITKTPKDLRDDCFTAFNIYKHSAHLKHGLVVSEWSKKKKKQLIDYKQDAQVDRSLFELPSNYKRFKTSN